MPGRVCVVQRSTKGKTETPYGKRSSRIYDIHCAPKDRVGQSGAVNAIISVERFEGHKVCNIAWFGVERKSPMNIGLGRDAYKHLEQVLKKQHRCGLVELTPDNKKAQKFWRKVGYGCSEDDMYDDIDLCVRMYKSLPLRRRRSKK